MTDEATAENSPQSPASQPAAASGDPAAPAPPAAASPPPSSPAAAQSAAQKNCDRCGRAFLLPPPGSTFYAGCPHCLTVHYVGPVERGGASPKRLHLPGQTESDGLTVAEGNCPGCGELIQVSAPSSTFYVACPMCDADLYIGP